MSNFPTDPPLGEPDAADLLVLRERRDSIPRYTIEQKDGTIYFRLVEDSEGAWVTYANHNAIVSKLEDRIVALAAAAQRAGEARPPEPPWPFDRTMAWIQEQAAYRDAPAPSKAMPWPGCLVQIIGQLLAAKVVCLPSREDQEL